MSDSDGPASKWSSQDKLHLRVRRPGHSDLRMDKDGGAGVTVATPCSDLYPMVAEFLWEHQRGLKTGKEKEDPALAVASSSSSSAAAAAASGGGAAGGSTSSLKYAFTLWYKGVRLCQEGEALPEEAFPELEEAEAAGMAGAKNLVADESLAAAPYALAVDEDGAGVAAADVPLGWLKAVVSTSTSAQVEVVYKSDVTREAGRQFMLRRVVRPLRAAAGVAEDDDEDEGEDSSEERGGGGGGEAPNAGRLAETAQFETWRENGCMYGDEFFEVGGAEAVMAYARAEGALDTRATTTLWCVVDWLSVRRAWRQHWIDAGIAQVLGLLILDPKRESLAGRSSIQRTFHVDRHPDALRQLAAVEGLIEHLEQNSGSVPDRLLEQVRLSQPRVKAARAS